MITKFNLTIANSYLVMADKPVLVDTGAPNSAARIIDRVKRSGVHPNDIALILLTHGHSDHAGSAEALRRLTGAPVAVHAGDVAMLARGTNGRMLPVGFEARVSQPFVDRPFPGLVPDIVIENGDELAAFGLPAQILHTPGHSAGSISLVFNSGDAIVGDILRGGIMGGALLSGDPHYPYFVYDRADTSILNDSVRRVLSAGANRLYVGHGGPITRDRVLAWLNRVDR